jgi:hypothetical protein
MLEISFHSIFPFFFPLQFLFQRREKKKPCCFIDFLIWVFWKIVAEWGYSFTMIAKREIDHDVKEKFCFVALISNKKCKRPPKAPL